HSVGHSPRALKRDELHRDPEPPGDLTRQIDGDTARLPAYGILLGEEEITVVDPGTQLPCRRQFHNGSLVWYKRVHMRLGVIVSFLVVGVMLIIPAAGCWFNKYNRL